MLQIHWLGPKRIPFSVQPLLGLFAGVILTMIVPHAGAQSASSLARKGNDFYKHQRYGEAADAYLQGLKLNPTSPLLQYNLGTALAQQGRTNDAQQALTQAAEVPGSPQRRDALFNLGYSLADSALKPPEPPAQGPAGAAPAVPPAAGSNAPGPQAPAVPMAPGKDVLKEKIGQLENALKAYREAILTDPKDSVETDEARYNYEVVDDMLRQLKQQQKQMEQKEKQPSQNKKNDRQQQQNQQNQDQKQDQNQQQDQANNQQNSQKNQQNGQQDAQGQKQGLQQQPTPQQDGQTGQQEQQQASAGQGQEQPMTQEQMDAVRLLNLLESEKPEQFKQLFRFQGQRTERPPEKDW